MIYLGVVAGLAASGAIAAVFMALFGGSGPQQEIMEGVCALVAMGMLLYTSNWMLNKSSVDRVEPVHPGQNRSRRRTHRRSRRAPTPHRNVWARPASSRSPC